MGIRVNKNIGNCDTKRPLYRFSLNLPSAGVAFFGTTHPQPPVLITTQDKQKGDLPVGEKSNTAYTRQKRKLRLNGDDFRPSTKSENLVVNPRVLR